MLCLDPRTENTEFAVYRVILLCDGTFHCTYFLSLRKIVFVIQVAHQNISSIDLDALSVSDASSIASPDHMSGLGHGVMVNHSLFESLPNHTQRFSLFPFPVLPRYPAQEVEGYWPKVPLPGSLWIPMPRHNSLLLIAQLSLPSLWVILKRTCVESYLPPFS